MKITMEKSLVEVTPESDSETKSLSALWDVLVDCARFNKKLVPVGEFVPGVTKQARFTIEK
jgi:hypothetical protein